MPFKTFLILLAWAALTRAVPWRPFTISLHEIVCYRYAEPLAEFKCNQETFRNQTVVNMHIIFSQEVKAFQFETYGDIPQPTGAPTRLFHLKVDGCSTLTAIRGNNIMKVVVSHLQKVGHVPKKCPVRANENFTLTRYVMEADILPLYTPEFNFEFVVNGIIDSIVTGRMVMKGRVESKRKRLNG